ncbi:hypothetical protein DXG01_000476 [Tephrocybe rancida]|nr:hypothetical protein DXG01_000476 [Tephrocybe rancida]
MADPTPDNIIDTIKHLDGIIHKTFLEGYPYQSLKGFYPIHLKKTASWPSVVHSKEEKVIEAHIYSPAFQMVHLLQEYSQQAHDHPENKLNAWHVVLRGTADRKYISNLPDAILIPPGATWAAALAISSPVPVPSPIPGPVPVPEANTAPQLVPVPIAIADGVAGAAPPVEPQPAMSGPPTTSAPVPGAIAKVRTTVMTPIGHSGHGPTLAKGKVVGVTSSNSAKAVAAPAMAGNTNVPSEETKARAGKQEPNPEEDGWYIDSIHAFPCHNCEKHNYECKWRVGKDNKVGACIRCFLAKIGCLHSMKGKGKKQEDAGSEAPKKAKAKPKHKAPKSPEYVSNIDDKASPVKAGHLPAAGKQKALAPQPRSPTPTPSNNPLLAAALEEGDWFAEMVQYVNEANAGNVEHRQCLTSTVGRLSAIVDALPSGAAAIEEACVLTSRVSDFEESTDTSFKRLKERILKHREHCNQTSACVTNLEDQIQRLEQRELEHDLSVEPSGEDEEGEEGEVSEEEDGCVKDVSGGDVEMDEFSEDPPSPSSQNEPEEGEIPQVITNADKEAEDRVEPIVQESNDVSAMVLPAEEILP